MGDMQKAQTDRHTVMKPNDKVHIRQIKLTTSSRTTQGHAQLTVSFLGRIRELPLGFVQAVHQWVHHLEGLGVGATTTKKCRLHSGSEKYSPATGLQHR